MNIDIDDDIFYSFEIKYNLFVVVFVNKSNFWLNYMYIVMIIFFFYDLFLNFELLFEFKYK